MPVEPGPAALLPTTACRFATAFFAAPRAKTFPFTLWNEYA
jgi:hypothetical protein